MLADNEVERVLREFRALQPIMENVARAMTRNTKLHVKMTKGGRGTSYTDGTDIWLPAPAALAATMTHERRLCDRRDKATGILLCGECDRRERLLAMLCHEVGHLSGESMAGRKDIPREWEMPETPWLQVWQHEELKEMLYRADYMSYVDNYFQMAPYAGKFFQMCLNAIEDIRIEAAITELKPGTADIFRSMKHQAVMGSEEEYVPEEQRSWSGKPMNFQILAGMIFANAGLDIAPYFNEKVTEDVARPEIRAYLAQVTKLKSVREVFAMCLRLYGDLIKLGYFEQPEPEAPKKEEPQPEGDSPEQSEEPSSDKDKEGGDGAGESDSSDGGAGESDDSSGDESGTGEGESPSGESDVRPEDAPADNGSGSPAPGESEAESGDTGPDGPAGTDSSEGFTQGDQDGPSTDPESPGIPSDDAQGRVESHGQDRDAGPSGVPDADDDVDQGDDSAGAGELDRPSEDGQDQDRDGSAEQADGDGQDDSADHEASGTGSGANRSDASADQEGDLEQQEVEQDEAVVLPSENKFSWGTPDEIEPLMDGLLGHENGEFSRTSYGEDVGKTLDHTELNQASAEAYKPAEFNRSSERVKTLSTYVHKDDKWVKIDGSKTDSIMRDISRRFGDKLTADQEARLHPGEKVLGRSVMELRMVFEANARGGKQDHLKSGKINPRVLGKRAPLGDPRLFRQRTLPKKRDYFVVIHLDVSGSTRSGDTLYIEKAAVYAQAEMLHRIGVPFEILAATGSASDNGTGYHLAVFEVKRGTEPWGPAAKKALADLVPMGGNLDGHQLQVCMHRAYQSSATDKVIMYYTDGKMPAANYSEELEVLQRSIATCKRDGITLMGVGIKTDSPKAHGLDTVVMESAADISAVVKHLGKRMRA